MKYSNLTVYSLNQKDVSVKYHHPNSVILLISLIYPSNTNFTCWSYFMSRLKYILNCLRLKKYNIQISISEISFKISTKGPVKIPEQEGEMLGRKTLVLDLDETLVHSSFSYISDSDFDLSLNVNGNHYRIYVRIRPGAEEFIEQMSKYFEIIIFTASMAEYANPVIDKLDPRGICKVRLFRENCTCFNQYFVKDLSKINRELSKIIIIDNSPGSFVFQPMNAIQIRNFFSDPTDTELIELMGFLVLISKFGDVRPVGDWLKKYEASDRFAYLNSEGKKMVFDKKEEIDVEFINELDSCVNKMEMNDSFKVEEDESFIMKESDHSHNKWGLKMETVDIQLVSEEEQEDLFRERTSLNSPIQRNGQEISDYEKVNESSIVMND